MINKTARALKRSQKRAQKKVKFMLRHPLLLPVSVFFAVIIVGLLIFINLGATTGGAKDIHVVDIFVDDSKQSVSTRAKTVQDLLNRLDLNIIKEDIVEPARDSQIIEDGTQINIYRARPVSVVDGDRTITVLSAQHAPRLLVHEAGITLLPEDKVAFSVTTDTSDALNTLASEELIINRSIEIQLNIFGVISKIRTTSDTVSELLKERGITVNNQETVQPQNIETKITKGMLISVNKPGVSILAVKESIPYQIERRTDANITTGTTRIDQEGVNGEQAVIYEIIEEKGVEISRSKLQIVVTIDPINKVVVRGTKLTSLSSSVSVSGDKASLMAAAGISASDYAYVDYIVRKESNWRPGAYNSGSGAYGLCQSLPASKMASAGGDYLTNPVTQLRWCANYASRYGGWQGAYNAWIAQNWW